MGITNWFEEPELKSKKNVATFIALWLVLIIVGLMVLIGISSIKANAEDGANTFIMNYYNKTFSIMTNDHVVSSYTGDFKVTRELDLKWDQVEFVAENGMTVIWVFGQNLNYEIK